MIISSGQQKDSAIHTHVSILPQGLPGGSDGKESACNAGDPGLILGQEDPLEEGMATHSSIFAWKISTDRGAWLAIVHRVTKSRTQMSN